MFLKSGRQCSIFIIQKATIEYISHQWLWNTYAEDHTLNTSKRGKLSYVFICVIFYKGDTQEQRHCSGSSVLHEPQVGNSVCN